MVFHWRLSERKSPQVSRAFLSILSVFNNAVVWMVSTRPPTSKSSRPFNNPLVTVTNAPIKIGIIVTFCYYYRNPEGVMVNYFLSGLVGPQVFERKCKSNWKVQASTVTTITGIPNVSKIHSCLVTG